MHANNIYINNIYINNALGVVATILGQFSVLYVSLKIIGVTENPSNYKYNLHKLNLSIQISVPLDLI